MGLEFNNKIFHKLCQRCQIKHETTAAYNPRTNGLTERFNQTLCDSLRKHAEMNHLDWVKGYLMSLCEIVAVSTL
jgi:hypothetical protein